MYVSNNFQNIFFFIFLKNTKKNFQKNMSTSPTFFSKIPCKKWNMCTSPTVRNFRTSGRSLLSALMSRFRAWVRLQLQKCPLFCTEFLKIHFFHVFYIFIVFFYNINYSFNYFIGKIGFIPKKITKCTSG